MAKLSLIVALCTVLACSARMGLPDADGSETSTARDAGADAAPVILADEQRPPEGVMDRGRDPALVLLRGPNLDCSATFVAKDVVLTARPCVAGADPGALSIHFGDEPDDEPASARGLEILVDAERDESDDDVAFVVLDATFTTQQPVGMRASGVAAGNRARAVGHSVGTERWSRGLRLLREHVRVRGEAGPLFYLAEAGCRFVPGGPALDEATGQILGVLTGPGDTCDGEDASNRYVRIEGYADLFDRALARSGLAATRDDHGVLPADAKPRGASRPGTRKPPSEVGGMCAAGSDCATGLCIVQEDRTYCSRACGRGDRCPATYHCESVAGASSTACVLAP